jgi:hypothetical protein
MWRWPEDVCTALETAMMCFIKATQCWVLTVSLSDPLQPSAFNLSSRGSSRWTGTVSLLKYSSLDVRDFDVSWFVMTNRVETTLLVIRPPPLPCCCADHSQLSQGVPASEFAFDRYSWRFFRFSLITNIENVVLVKHQFTKCGSDCERCVTIFMSMLCIYLLNGNTRRRSQLPAVFSCTQQLSSRVVLLSVPCKIKIEIQHCSHMNTLGTKSKSL